MSLTAEQALAFEAALAIENVPAVDPAHRLRRMRRDETLRAFVRETRIHPRQLVAPLFVFPGAGRREPVGSMPGVERVTPDEALQRRAARSPSSGSAA